MFSACSILACCHVTQGFYGKSPTSPCHHRMQQIMVYCQPSRLLAAPQLAARMRTSSSAGARCLPGAACRTHLPPCASAGAARATRRRARRPAWPAAGAPPRAAPVDTCHPARGHPARVPSLLPCGHMHDAHRVRLRCIQHTRQVRSVLVHLQAHKLCSASEPRPGAAAAHAAYVASSSRQHACCW